MVFSMRRFTILATSITELYFPTVVNAGCVGIGSKRDEPFEATRKKLRVACAPPIVRHWRTSLSIAASVAASLSSRVSVTCLALPQGFKRAKRDTGLVWAHIFASLVICISYTITVVSVTGESSAEGSRQKRGFFKNFWKKSRHYSLEHQ
jgi:hypothetical protein